MCPPERTTMEAVQEVPYSCLNELTGVQLSEAFEQCWQTELLNDYGSITYNTCLYMLGLFELFRLDINCPETCWLEASAEL